MLVVLRAMGGNEGWNLVGGEGKRMGQRYEIAEERGRARHTAGTEARGRGTCPSGEVF